MRLVLPWLLVAACASKKEPSQQQPPPPPPPAPSSPATNATPCVVRAALTTRGITLAGGGISGRDVTALRSVAKTCSVQLTADDDVSFEDVTSTVKLVGEQGIAEVRLGQPLGQWMSMDLGRVTKLWTTEPAAALIAAVKADAPRLGADNAPVVDQVTSALGRARQDEAIGKQTTDRGMFEAVAQIVGLRRATAPVAIDLLEQAVMPALEIDATAVAAGDASNAQTGVELFQLFVARASKRTVVKGLLGAIPDADLSTPYADNKPNEIRDGDWIVVATAPLAKRLAGYDQRTLVAQYDRFLARGKLRDDDRVLVDASARALADLAACVATAVQNKDALVFRALPPPVVTVSDPGNGQKLPTVVITNSDISIEGAPAGRPVLSSLPQTSPRTIVIAADRSLAFGRIRLAAAAIAAPGYVTFVLRPR